MCRLYNIIYNLCVIILSVSEFEKLKNSLEDYQVFRFEPTQQVLERYKDGGVAIIDQWIAAHARYVEAVVISKVKTCNFVSV